MSTLTGPPISIWPSASSSTPRPSARASATPPNPCSSTATSPTEFLPGWGRPWREWSCGGTKRPGDSGTGPGVAATDDDFGREFLDLILSVKVVGDLDEAIAHIRRYGSGHTEAIVTRDLAAAQRFQREVDAAAVLVNASTRFTDGEEFGFGAEIGISTQKLHARGPMGLRELTTTKYLVTGTGQIRG